MTEKRLPIPEIEGLRKWAAAMLDPDEEPAITFTVSKDGIARAIIHDDARHRIADSDQLVGLMRRVMDLVTGYYPMAAGCVRHESSLLD